MIPMDRVIELNAVPPYEELLLSADGEIVASIAENDTVRIAKSPDKVTLSGSMAAVIMKPGRKS